MKILLRLLSIPLFVSHVLLAELHTPNTAVDSSGTAIQAPVLKWQDGGCYNSWCETGWYSSPAVADLDGDGKPEVIGSAYTIFVLDGATGNLKWHMPSGHDRSQPDAGSVGRTWPGIGLADVDGNGDLEIITAHSGGYVSVYNHNGYFEPGWPQQPTTSELRGLSIFDLDQDGSQEIVVTAAIGSPTNTWVYEHDGVLRSGWPQLSDESGYAWGVYNDNSALGDLDGDGYGEIVMPSDVHYICAYEANGTQIPANSMYGGKGWGKVGVWESLEIELRGWGTCTNGDPRAERYRPNFAHSPALIVDVNADGINEAVAVGNMYDCIDGYPSRYIALYIFNADRSRFSTSGYDWRTIPVDTGAPLSEDYGVIENAQPNPAAADLDGDGYLEILYASYDGRLHAFWLDKTEHGSWPYSVYDASEGFYRFASEPTIADLDDDGHAEVIFTSWTQIGSGQTGKLHILDYLGNPIHEISLPAAWDDSDWNGALPAPTLANIDGDPDLEVVVNTAHTGLVAYDLPGTSQARILWGTGRGNYQRSGSMLQGNLNGSSKAVNRSNALLGDELTYTITLSNPGPALTEASITDTLPPEVTFAGGLEASSGTVSESSGVISWSGAVPARTPVEIRFNAAVRPELNGSRVIENTAEIEDGLGNTILRQTLTFVGGFSLYLPIAGYNFPP